MEFDDDLLADLVASIEEHCKATIKADTTDKIAHNLAETILRLQQTRHEAFGHSDDTEALYSLMDLLSEVTVKVEGLSEVTKRKLDVKLPLPVSEKKESLSQFGQVKKLENGKIKLVIPPNTKLISTDDNHILKGCLDNIVALNFAIKELLESKPYKGKKISKKLSYDGVLAAKACKMIWRDELRFQAEENDTPVKSPNKYIKDEYDNDPMKAFIAEIFVVLGINKEVTSMLNALQTAGGEEELTVSIDIR